jgi:hypothetical protein
MRGLLLAALLFTQDAELDTLLQRLGDSDPVVREKATTDLAARGAAARETLEKGRGHADPEIRTRAASLLFRIDHAATLAQLEKTQRPAKLKLLETPEKELTGAVASTDGARFTFQRRAWAPKGTVLGTIFETRAFPHLTGDFEWSVAGIREGKELALERCDSHSPILVYVPGQAPAEPVVHLKGLRRWYCDVPVDFKNPANGTTHRVGPFAITIQWPAIVVHADAPIPDAVLKQVLKEGDLRIRLRNPDNRFGGGARFSVVSRCGVGAAPKDPIWCGCDGKPFRWEAPPPPMSQTLKVDSGNFSRYALEDIESIWMTFHKPVEEKFEVASPVLK